MMLMLMMIGQRTHSLSDGDFETVGRHQDLALAPLFVSSVAGRRSIVGPRRYSMVVSPAVHDNNSSTFSEQ